ncbi:neprilysin-2-like [Belonocnema kinseyi]|uniref:neprilysin-2-like n=1 Tax=Belonocnema kinseyi TaxID=2817044 RepID=UPI00143D3FDF|nr:neprilysin-2-like [Belonocnema kinseyi]
MIHFRMLIFLFLFCVSLYKSEILDDHTAETCLTSECDFVASIVSEYMDPTVSPCENFNQFVCGTFLNKTIIPKGKHSVSRFSIVEDKITEQLKAMLEEVTQPNEPRWITLAKNYYSSCTNTNEIERNGLRGVFGDLKQFGGWPVLEKSWNATKYEWKDCTYTMQKLGYGASYFFGFHIITDPLNSKKRVINIDRPTFTIGSDSLVKGLNDPMVTAYFDYMVDISVLFGADRKNARKELKESLCFEINLAMISQSEGNESNKDDLNNRMTVADLSENYATIPWNMYLNKLYSVIESEIVISDNEPIEVGSPRFFKHFETLIKNTPKRVQANYHVWQAVQDNLNFLTEKIWMRNLEFRNMLYGENKLPDRRQHCIDQTLTTYLRWSVGALYVRKHFSRESKKSAEELALAIQRQFEKMISEAEWVDEITRLNALKRLASMKNFIGCPSEYFDDNTLNEFFKEAEASPNDFFKAASTIAVFCYNYDFNKLRKHVNTAHWTLHGETYIAGSFFALEGNGPDVAAGILRDVFFNRHALSYMNYAVIGSFNIGYVMAYVFADIDAYMTQETQKIYLAKADCFTKQYGSYTVEEVGLKINGTTTQMNNILDNAGLKAAYRAYQEWSERHLPEPKLRGLTNYSISQIFWILAALQECEKYETEYLKEIVQSGNVSPSGFRIVGTVSNSPEFARDFNCPPCSKMNPADKCSIW